MLPGGRFVATATSVQTLLRIAFGIDDNNMSGTPAWVRDETFDINAITTDHLDVTTPQQFQQVILALLKDRFAFQFHVEQKETAIYWLELDSPGKPGPFLKPSGPDSQPSMSTNANSSKVTMLASKTSMADLAAALRRQAGRPVEDHTGLKGDFDFELQWSRSDAADPTDPSLFTVLKERLGLKLKSAKGSTNLVVIDHINYPTAN